ncbi:MAG: nucleoside phosphorylase [Candidatus Electrothrix sp. GW3-4]|uniref:nucleoside phosphorylase n=1 Tax=Candidatus Electrothrix sp. GW3-4 TaxID=3126740 RepID=UPI0030CBEB4C
MNKQECVINPERGRGEPTLPEIGLLAVNPTEAPVLAAYAKEAGMQRSFLFHSNLYYSDRLFLAGPAVGAPMAVMCLEKLIALGAKKVILYGWCGSLQERLHALDVFLPTDALSEEGTSRHYQDDQENTISASPKLHEQLGSILTAADMTYQTGKIWTTDAPYRETRAKITEYANLGIYGVDMELSALCAVAAFRSIEVAAAMLVSDEVWRQPWQPQFSRKEFKRKSRKLLMLLCNTL